MHADEECFTEQPHVRFQERVRSNIPMEKNSYSRAEVLAAGNTLPDRGPLCHECGARIPVFDDIPEAAEQRVRQCIRENRHLMAMIELRYATGCSLPWAKLWVQHSAGPKPARKETPCPYCGMALRTSLARQCRFCWRDWHDEDNVVQLYQYEFDTCPNPIECSITSMGDVLRFAPHLPLAIILRAVGAARRPTAVRTARAVTRYEAGIAFTFSLRRLTCERIPGI